MSTVSSRRYLSLWLRRLSTDRTARHSGAPSDVPFALVGPVKNALVLTAVNDEAVRLGLRAGQRFTDARAMYPALAWKEADEGEDARLLKKIAEWCTRYTPLAGIHPPDGVLLDITGCAHLFGGERPLARDLLKRIGAQGLRARIGIVDTVGAAWAVARFGKTAIVPAGKTNEILLPLPLAGLRLPPDMLMALSGMGLRTIADIASRPRAALTARFGAELMRRLDQALGREEESIAPLLPPASYSVEQGFAEPLLRDEDVLLVVERLTARLCALLKERDEGARELFASFFGVDGTSGRLAVGTSIPSRNAKHLHRLFAEKFAQQSFGSEFGYDRIRLSVTRAEPFTSAQKDWSAHEDGFELAHLIDRLSARLSDKRVLRLVAQDTHVPEYACAAIPARDAEAFLPVPPTPSPSPNAGRGMEHDTLVSPRPIRLFERPEPVEAIAEIPDGPPVRFRWRRVLHEVARAEGPERIAMPWWRDEKRASATRDYFRVESKEGARLWLFREGLYGEASHPSWFLHGILP